jgi:hypothetical protein
LEYVELNQLGDPGYRIEDPWISKRRCDKRIAADIHYYVDDIRETAPTAEMAWLASSQRPKLLLGSVSRMPPGTVGLQPRSR